MKKYFIKEEVSTEHDVGLAILSCRISLLAGPDRIVNYSVCCFDQEINTLIILACFDRRDDAEDFLNNIK